MPWYECFGCTNFCRWTIRRMSKGCAAHRYCSLRFFLFSLFVKHTFSFTGGNSRVIPSFLQYAWNASYVVYQFLGSSKLTKEERCLQRCRWLGVSLLIPTKTRRRPKRKVLEAAAVDVVVTCTVSAFMYGKTAAETSCGKFSNSVILLCYQDNCMVG